MLNENGTCSNLELAEMRVITVISISFIWNSIESYHLENIVWLMKCAVHTTGRLIRYSKDTRPANTQVMRLIEFCKDMVLLIMNGRINSDEGVGDFTRMEIGVSSVVDYIIASPAMLDMLCDFQICEKLPESYHLPIMFSINCNYERTHKSGSHVNWAPHVKYVECERLAKYTACAMWWNFCALSWKNTTSAVRRC